MDPNTANKLRCKQEQCVNVALGVLLCLFFPKIDFQRYVVKIL